LLLDSAPDLFSQSSVLLAFTLMLFTFFYDFAAFFILNELRFIDDLTNPWVNIEARSGVAGFY
tara:strand:- start:132 stop:320 length:189 start_codon:yes stop_codon:yes gene_type:complete